MIKKLAHPQGIPVYSNTVPSGSVAKANSIKILKDKLRRQQGLAISK
jgi:hypothetical protein